MGERTFGAVISRWVRPRLEAILRHLVLFVGLCAAAAGCKARRSAQGGPPTADAPAAEPRAKTDLSAITRAKVEGAGASLGLKPIAEFCRDDLNASHSELYVPLGRNDKLDVHVMLWDFSRGRKGETRAHRVGALQALSVYTREPAYFAPARYVEQFLQGAPIDALTVSRLKQAIARAKLELHYCSDEESTYASQGKDDYFNTEFWLKDTEDHELDVELWTYVKAVKQPSLEDTVVLTDADRVLLVFAHERRMARKLVEALLGRHQVDESQGPDSQAR